MAAENTGEDIHYEVYMNQEGLLLEKRISS
jgi:hypothetical protein